MVEAPEKLTPEGIKDTFKRRWGKQAYHKVLDRMSSALEFGNKEELKLFGEAAKLLQEEDYHKYREV